jgi:hypothetical protein
MKKRAFSKFVKTSAKKYNINASNTVYEYNPNSAVARIKGIHNYSDYAFKMIEREVRMHYPTATVIPGREQSITITLFVPIDEAIAEYENFQRLRMGFI